MSSPAFCYEKSSFVRHILNELSNICSEEMLLGIIAS